MTPTNFVCSFEGGGHIEKNQFLSISLLIFKKIAIFLQMNLFCKSFARDSAYDLDFRQKEAF